MIKFFIGILLSLSLFAATTGSVTISGTVPVSIGIVITTAPVYNTLDLSTTQTNLQILTVEEISNSSTGYNLTVASSNSGKLVNGTYSVAYTAKYNSVSFTLSSTPVNVTSQAGGVYDGTKPLQISYTGQQLSKLLSGSYTDTLTFVMTAK